MKAYVVLKTYKTDIADIFPNVLKICDSLQYAIEVIADECDTTVEEVESELDDYNCYDMANVRYTIFKYFD